MRVSQQTSARTAQTRRLNPRLIAAGAILQMAGEELALRVEEEIASNPALEVTWDQSCPDCGRPLARGVCWVCHVRKQSAADRPMIALPLEYGSSQHRNGSSGSEMEEGRESYDPVENASLPLSLQEHVREQARLALPSSRFPIAEYLLAGLNDDGLLETSVEEAATALAVPPTEVEEVLAVLQTLDPPGVCGRSAQESVLIQVWGLAPDHPVPEHAETVLRHHWRDLANHAYGKIARALGVEQEAVGSIVEFMRKSLCPYPGRLFHPPHVTERHEAEALRPDVIVRREAGHYRVEIVRPYDFELRVSEAYRRLCASRRGSGTESADHQQALEHYRRATWLMQSLRSRELTLQQIAEYTVAYQRPFLDTGQETRMKMLTRTRVAEHIGKEVSTVSRAVADKYVCLPNGDLLAFAKLFAPAVAPRTIIAELLAAESPDSPLTDEKIARILQVRGITVARRTIAKYRLSLRLPSSVQRGRH
jgi:RNA polymerase sigma-54 factor